LKLLSHHEDTTIAAHGFKVNNTMMSMKARILPAPRLIYGGNRTMSPRDGRWNLRGLKFIKPSTIKSWVLVYIPARQPLDNGQLERFGGEMVRSFSDCGMNVPREGPPVMVGNPFGNLIQVTNDAVARAHNKFGSPPDVIFYILQGASTPIYKTLKAGLDVHLGIASQVMLQEKALSGRGSAQYLANIAMKVNVKLGGTNCFAEEPLFQGSRCMLLGGDISHAAPGALRSVNPPPSTAALVATWDRECTAYTAVASVQESLLGYIQNAKPMMAELLKRYAEKNKGSK
jgi:eukaryotic translation initiation factor 2C